MYKYYLPSDIRNADKIAVENHNINSFYLMETAGSNAGKIILDKFPEIKNFLIFCGSGNNAGDGFILADFLLSNNKNVIIITSCELTSYKNDARLASDKLQRAQTKNLTIRYIKLLDINEINNYLDISECYIDALLGTGAMGEPRNEIKYILDLIKKRERKLKIALDIPSGINARDGSVCPNCFKADLTITFLEKKLGMVLYPASSMCGEIVIAGIGVQKDKVLNEDNSLDVYNSSDINDFLPIFPENIHKGNRGSVLILGGSYNYRGAPLLSALGALRTGAGVVYLAIPDFMVETASLFLPEAVFIPLKTKNNVILHENLYDYLSPIISKVSSIVIGPGIGREVNITKILNEIYTKFNKVLIIDADALHFLSKHRFEYRPNTVITPHHGEAAGILNVPVDDVNLDRLEAINKLSSKFDIVLLKGKNTLIKHKNKIRIINAGSRSLSVPGSGDVLTGAIATFAAWGLSLFDATTLAALIHATAGNLLENRNGIHGNLAREIANEMQKCLNK
ncbi:MAG: NAD(P)H-hydrate dehydratase [Synergistaceae bacterium]